MTLPKNSVGTKQLKKNAVTGKEIKKNAVTAAKVKDASLLAQDFAAGQLPAGAKGDQGPPGPTFGSGAVTSGAHDPVANPDETSPQAASYGRHYDFTLPSGGNVYVRMFAPAWAVGCPSGTARGGLYFDGAPVPKAARDLPPQAMPSSPYPPVELVATVPAGAGPHSVEARYDCASGVNTGFYMPSGITWSVFLLGS